MAYLLDALDILILIFCVWRGFKQGLIRTAVMLVGFLAAALIAGQLSGPIAAGVYDGMIAPGMEDTLVEQVVAAGETQVEIRLSSLLGDNETVEAYLADLGLATSITLGFDDLSESAVRQGVQPAMQQVVRPAVVQILSAVVTVLLFLVLLIAVCLLARLLDKVFQLPLLRQLNRFGGLFAGVLQGVFWAMIFAVLVRFVADCGVLGSVLTVEAVEASALTSRLAGWNWIFIGKV